MKVTTTGRPRSAASETGAPFWSARRKTGARFVPAAHVVAGPDVIDVDAWLDEWTSAPAIPAPIPTSTTAPQIAHRSRETCALVGGDELRDATSRGYPRRPSGHQRRLRSRPRGPVRHREGVQSRRSQ